MTRTVESVVVRLSPSVTLIHGDCADVLPVQADACITDPPYGVEFRGEAWDKDIPPVALQLPQMFDRTAIIMGTTAAWQFPQPKWVACWARPASSSRSKVGGFSHWSPVLLYGNCKMSVDFKSWHAIANAYPPGFPHPSPKPECVMQWLVDELTTEGETVLDPFMGSGTTGVACIRYRRKFIGIEKDAAYFEVARKRLEAEMAQGLLDFGGGAVAPTQNPAVEGRREPTTDHKKG